MKRRKRGEGLIRQRKEGRWEIKAWVWRKTLYAYADTWAKALEPSASAKATSATCAPS